MHRKPVVSAAEEFDEPAAVELDEFVPDTPRAQIESSSGEETGSEEDDLIDSEEETDSELEREQEAAYALLDLECEECVLTVVAPYCLIFR